MKTIEGIEPPGPKVMKLLLLLIRSTVNTTEGLLEILSGDFRYKPKEFRFDSSGSSWNIQYVTILFVQSGFLKLTLFNEGKNNDLNLFYYLHEANP
jgi:hypothetical protein